MNSYYFDIYIFQLKMDRFKCFIISVKINVAQHFFKKKKDTFISSFIHDFNTITPKIVVKRRN